MTQDEITAAIDEAFAVSAQLQGMLAIEMVGSARYLPDPKDVDYVILFDSPQLMSTAAEVLMDEGWTPESQYFGTGVFFVLRQGHFNFILTATATWYSDYIVAAKTCETLLLKEKRDRIIVNQIIRDKRSPEDAKCIADAWVRRNASYQVMPVAEGQRPEA